MPLYDYHCRVCGPFRTWASMEHATRPQGCPDCGEPAARQLATPYLSTMDGRLRRAESRCEKSAHEPQVVSRQHVDNCGCSICAGRKKKSVHGRWMIGHC